jgi:hypothetical protein
MQNRPAPNPELSLFWRSQKISLVLESFFTEGTRDAFAVNT